MHADTNPAVTGRTAPDQRLVAGESVRRQVLGDAHVDRSQQNATEFSRPLQELVTEYCWGAIWTRPGLERQTRSLINIAMLTALGRLEELKLHVRGSINNGCSAEQIQEVLLQVAVYCGVPAALDATRVAQRTLDEIADE